MTRRVLVVVAYRLISPVLLRLLSSMRIWLGNSHVHYLLSCLTRHAFRACLGVLFFSLLPLANGAGLDTGRGKIIVTQGHSSAPCRMVLFQLNSTGVQTWFRIPVVSGGQDNISAVILAALTANRDVSIFYDPAVTTGCGSEPAITIVSIF